MSSSPGIVAKAVAPKPGPVLRALAWLLIVVSPVPVVIPAVALFQNWDRLGEATSPLWVGPAVMLCYVTFGAAFLCVGRGVLTGRVTLAVGGGLLFFGALITFLGLFSTFD